MEFGKVATAADWEEQSALYVQQARTKTNRSCIYQAHVTTHTDRHPA